MLLLLSFPLFELSAVLSSVSAVLSSVSVVLSSGNVKAQDYPGLQPMQLLPEWKKVFCFMLWFQLP